MYLRKTCLDTLLFWKDATWTLVEPSLLTETAAGTHCEQVFWAAVTLWCLCLNPRSLSRRRVKHEHTKKLWWPFSFSRTPKFLHESQCYIRGRSPLRVYALDPKMLLWFLPYVQLLFWICPGNSRPIFANACDERQSQSVEDGFDLRQCFTESYIQWKRWVATSY